MLLSHARRFVMFQPWKTASQTLRARLAPFDESPYPKFFHFNAHLRRVVHQHLTCADFASLPESRLGYFTASFVRNPYDRVYSGFGQLQRDLAAQPAAEYPAPWVRELVLAQLAENSAQLIRAGFRFDEWLSLVRDEQIFEAGRNTNFPLHPAHYWTHRAEQPAVDFIGRVENFEADFQVFLERASLGPLPSLDANVAHSKASAPPDENGYRHIARMERRSIEKINRLFARDFEIFGYRML